MDDYTRRTKEFLEQRFKDADRCGVYRSHAPIYGFSQKHIFLGLYKNNYTVFKEIEKLLSQYTINNFLEVGCAEGYTTHLIENIFGLKGNVLDLSFEAVKRAQEIYSLKGFVADAQGLECIKTDSFDLVLCLETLEHLPKPQKALEELLRIAKKSLIITVPAAKNMREKKQFIPANQLHTHLHIFTREELMNAPFFIQLRGISLKCLDKIEGLFTKDGKSISRNDSQCLVILYRLCRILFFPLRMFYGASVAKIFIKLDYLLGKILVFNAISYLSLYQKLPQEFKKKIEPRDILDFMLKQDKVGRHFLISKPKTDFNSEENLVMDKISVIVITRNEEGNIRDCLESVKWADEIVLVDQSSADKTVEAAKKFTDKIYIVEPKELCEPDREFAISKTKNNWVLYIDADERLSPALKLEIKDLLSSSEQKYAYFVPRKVFLEERWIKGCGWYPSYTIRLFKKGKVYFSPEIFTDGKPLGSYGYLKEHILHYSYKNLAEYFKKSNHYTSILADKEYKDGIRINKMNFLVFFFVKPLYWFLKKYFLLKGYRDGMCGLVISFGSALGIFITYAKLWEKQNLSLNRNLKDGKI